MPPLTDSVRRACALPCVPPGQAVVVVVNEPELPAEFTVIVVLAVTEPEAFIAVRV